MTVLDLRIGHGSSQAFAYQMLTLQEGTTTPDIILAIISQAIGVLLRVLSCTYISTCSTSPSSSLVDAHLTHRSLGHFELYCFCSGSEI